MIRTVVNLNFPINRSVNQDVVFAGPKALELLQHYIDLNMADCVGCFGTTVYFKRADKEKARKALAFMGDDTSRLLHDVKPALFKT